MTDTLAALRHAVLLSPADDVVRCVYADACLESGDEELIALGDLILLQIERGDEGRQRELVGRWLGRWLQPEAVGVVEHVRGDRWHINFGVDVVVSRGFVSSVRLTDPIAEATPGGRWTERTPEVVAELYASAVGAIFAGHPVNAVHIDLFASETWLMAVVDDPATAARRWTWAGPRAGTRPWEWTHEVDLADPRQMEGRQAFWGQVRHELRDRLLTLGRHVLHIQRGERDNRDWGAGIL